MKRLEEGVIRENRATFVVSSTTWTVREISELLGLEPTDSADIGEPRAAARGGTLRAQSHHQRTVWALDVDADRDPDDESGFAALRTLVELLTPMADALATLRTHGETVLWWSGDSDSSQGGFVLDARLLAGLAKLGCDVYGTASLADAPREQVV